ncbi:MAG: hypothetical protein OXC46_06810 [Thaumarchaeota archaeon]|nr:hypothetical protein [Nitrososphaerota archaeon]
MNGTFDELCDLYERGAFSQIEKYDNGFDFLLLRAMSRPALLKEYGEYAGLEIPTDTKSSHLFKLIFEQSFPQDMVMRFINNKFSQEREERKSKENFLYTQLYKLEILDWGGLYQNALEQNIVNNYVKKIMDFDELNKKIDTEIHPSLVGYVNSSWYNHWSSILIEDMFKDHQIIIPAIGKVKGIDFFWNETPLDLKVTFLPVEYMQMIRRKNNKSELSSMKSFAKEHDIDFDNEATNKNIFNELFRKISESQAPEAIEFFTEFKKERLDIVEDVLKEPKKLAKWLYENQGEKRFDASNRFYLILIDSNNLEQSWKLKRNRDVLPTKITEFLNEKQKNQVIELDFEWRGTRYTTKCFVLFIMI